MPVLQVIATIVRAIVDLVRAAAPKAPTARERAEAALLIADLEARRRELYTHCGAGLVVDKATQRAKCQRCDYSIPAVVLRAEAERIDAHKAELAPLARAGARS